MPFDYENQEEYWPKIGTEKQLTITEVSKVNDPGNPINFKSKIKNFGYHYIISLDNGRDMILNNFGLYTQFKQCRVKEGDTIIVRHPEHGVWKVVVV